jgi:hypothetical protein
VQPVLESTRAEGGRRGIGTLQEGALHAQLKEWYRRLGDRLEERVAGYVVDLVRGQVLVEIQTAASRRCGASSSSFPAGSRCVWSRPCRSYAGSSG